MRRFVEDYVRTCDTCCRAKMPRHHPYGLLEPLPLPSKPWQSISLDFITDLPVSKGFDAILTIVDRYTKMTHFLPCTKAITSEETAEVVMREVFRHHGLILDGVCSKLRSYLQILVQRIIWSGYARYKQIYLLIYIKLNKHRRLMRIVIGFHPVLTLEIGYGYYDDISRLLDHAINWIIDD